VWGDPAAEICRVAQERQMDLIAMSTHGRTGRTLELIGSVADAVVRRAPCAVLIFRATLFEAARG
jgi:nucleotide-binding universal stress UspA family protein